MHELSIVMGIINIAYQQAAKHRSNIIEEIELDIGCLSAIEIDAFEFAWKQAVKHTILEGVIKKINRISGKAKCLDCDFTFAIEHLYDACPVCNSHFIDIKQGKELRVKSFVVA